MAHTNEAIRNFHFERSTSNNEEEDPQEMLERSTSNNEEEDPQEMLDDFLFCYWKTSHRSTGRTPVKLLCGRQLRTEFDQLKPDISHNMELEQWKIVEQTRPYSCIVEIDGGRRRKHADQTRKREASTIGGAKPLTEVPQNIQLLNPSEFQESSQISENLTPLNHNLKDSATDPGTCDTPTNEVPQPLTPRRNPSRN
ncbi:hypothetical protein QE152_g22282 [Popillia japonica]|uniref:Uncharacterized protein n=1 Tax=Popillia japonica TaxID=7064 RepID=A0AAW1KL89_POPJA